MPQSGIFKGNEINNFALFREYKIVNELNVSLLKDNLLELYNSIELNVVVSLSRKAYQILEKKAPEQLVNFQEIIGVGNLKMPNTQGDVFIFSHSESKANIFDFGLQCDYLLNDLLKIDLNQEGFKYKDSRDITGFVDGSANPKEDSRKEEALVPIGELHQNGSFVLTQKWAHNLKAFHANPVEDQEGIIGRTKKESIELEGEKMPPNSHVSRTDVKKGGEAMKIFRRSYPFSNDDEHGLYFLAFSKSIERFDIQLKRMVGATDDRVSDRLMEFSSPKTGAYYFAPSDAELREILS